MFAKAQRLTDSNGFLEEKKDFEKESHVIVAEEVQYGKWIFFISCFDLVNLDVNPTQTDFSLYLKLGVVM